MKKGSKKKTEYPNNSKKVIMEFKPPKKKVR